LSKYQNELIGFQGVRMEDRWLSVDEICVYLGIKRDTVYKWINEKGMPANKVGRLWKFKKEKVDKWIENGSSEHSDLKPSKQ